MHTKPVNVEKKHRQQMAGNANLHKQEICVILFQDFAYPILHSSHSSKCEILTQHLLTIIFLTLASLLRYALCQST